MNLMGYDAMALGPLELSLGLDILQQRMAEARFPILSANVVLTDTGGLVTEPYAVVERGGRRLGILGLTRSPAEPVRGLWVLDPQEAAARYLPELAQQVDTVIVLTNENYRSGLALAQAVPGIDLLIAALPGQLPKEAVGAPGTGTLVVTAEQPMARHTGRRLGRLVLMVDSDGALRAESWASLPMVREIVDDPFMRTLLDKYRP